MTEEEYQILGDLYMTKWPAERRRTSSPMRRCEALYHLAKRAQGGVIVELGTYHGAGAISLAFGARAGYRMSVYTVDDYIGRVGWAGEKYYPQDRERFFDCIAYAGVEVSLIQKNATEAGEGWSDPVSLLSWDLGVKERLFFDLQIWKRHMIPGGIFAVKEAGGGPHEYWQMGFESVKEIALTIGWEEGEQFPEGHIYTLRWMGDEAGKQTHQEA